MLNQESIDAVKASAYNERFLRPIYEGYGFARLPDTATALLTGKASAPTLPAAVMGDTELPRFGKVIVLLLDAFGWNFMERALHSGQYPFLTRIAEQGVISKLTSQFPSTTTAHVSTMKSGQPVGEHGLYEWNLFDPSVGDIIVPLMYPRLEEAARTLGLAGVDSTRIFPPGPTYYEQLITHGVSSTLFEPGYIVNSTYNQHMSAGAKVSPYKSLAEGLVNLGQAVAQAEGPSYFYLYYDGIDTVCHKYGPDSEQVLAELDTTLMTLERGLQPLLEGQRDVALLLTADHGQSHVDPERTVYLNLELPQLVGWLERDRWGKPLKLAGSPRDVFLHLQPEHLDEAEAALRPLLRGKAEVHRTADLMDDGFFGPNVSERLRERMAALAILSYEHETVWWYEMNRSEMRNYGSHGSLERSEAEIPMLFQAY